MNINLLHETLMRAARSSRPSDRVPYAFEQRIMARIQAEPLLDVVSLWARALWRAAIPCVAVTLLFSVWATQTPGTTTPTETADLGADLETTLMASVSFDNDLAW
jgi:hypothetical protein